MKKDKSIKERIIAKLKKWFLTRFNFKSKLVLSYAVIVCIGVIAVGIYAHYRAVNLVEQNSKKAMSYSLDIIASEMESNISTYNDVILSFMGNKNVRDTIVTGYDPKRDGNVWNNMEQQFGATISAIQQSFSACKRITLYTDRDLPEVGKTLLKIDRIKEEPWYTSAADDDFEIQWVKDGKKILAVCPMLDLLAAQPGDKLGILCMEVSPDLFSARLEDSRYIVEIKDASGGIIYTTYPEPIKKQSENNGLVRTADGETYIKQSRALEMCGWEVNIYVAYGELVKESRAILTATLLICFACIVALFMLGVFMSNIVMKRIYALRTQMREVQSGNFDIEIKDDCNDEIGYITNQFGEMVVKLKDTISELYEREIIEKTQQLKILQAQINPHFLYNILSTIRWKVMENDDDESAMLIDALSKFYRTSLNKGQAFSSIKNELDNIRAYINMRLAMSEVGFEVVFDVDETVNDCECINFIIQPIVENAIMHGIENRFDGGGVLKIKTEAVGGNIVITVTDNGPDIDERKVREYLYRSGKSKGYGMWNVMERIRIVYGDKGKITVERCDGETNVSIILPKEFKFEY